MKLQSWIGPGLAALALLAFVPGAEARIGCNGAYQIVTGQGEIATPYCQDNYLAEVARGYGVRVSGAQIRNSPSRKQDVCRLIGHDGRVADLCVEFRRDRNRSRF